MTTILLAVLLSLTNPAPQQGAQQLRRHNPRTTSYEQNELSVYFSKDVPRATASGIAKYLIDRKPGFEVRAVGVYLMPSATDLYFVETPDYENSKYSFFLLRKKGAEITEVDRIDKEGCGLVETFFFAGRDRALIISSNMAMDGGFCNNYAFEFRDGRLKPSGEIYVYDGVHGKGGFQGHSPMEAATAEYRGGSYHITMRGKGNLYSMEEGERRLARRRTPLTYFYDGKEWRPARAGRRR